MGEAAQGPRGPGRGEGCTGAVDGLAPGSGGMADHPSACADSPSVSAVNAVVLAAIGEEAVLGCVVSGVPPPRVIWYRGEWLEDQLLPSRGSIEPASRRPWLWIPTPLVTLGK